MDNIDYDAANQIAALLKVRAYIYEKLNSTTLPLSSNKKVIMEIKAKRKEMEVKIKRIEKDIDFVIETRLFIKEDDVYTNDGFEGINLGIEYDANLI